MNKIEITTDQAKERLLAGETIFNRLGAEIFFYGGILFFRGSPTVESKSIGSIIDIYKRDYRWYVNKPYSEKSNPDAPMLLLDLLPSLKNGDEIETPGIGKAHLQGGALRWSGDNNLVQIRKSLLTKKWTRVASPFILMDQIDKGIRTFKTRDGRKAVDVSFLSSRENHFRVVGIIAGKLFSWGEKGNHCHENHGSDLVALWTDADDAALQERA